MISKEIRSLLLSKDQNYTRCNLSSHRLTDQDLVELADLVSQNPYITCIDLEYNTDITIEGVALLQKRLPNVKIVNCSCMLTIEEAMDRSTQTRRIPKVTFGSTFLQPVLSSTSSLSTDDYVLTEQNSDSICKL